MQRTLYHCPEDTVTYVNWCGGDPSFRDGPLVKPNPASVPRHRTKSQRQSLGWSRREYLYSFARQRGPQWANALKTVSPNLERVSEKTFLKKFIYYLFMAVLGLRFCARAFSSCSKRGPLFIVVHGPLTIAASLVAEHRLQTRRLSSCGSRA